MLCVKYMTNTKKVSFLKLKSMTDRKQQFQNTIQNINNRVNLQQTF